MENNFKLRAEVFDFTEIELTAWLRHEAGSSNVNYFNATFSGGLKLQQVPEEYARLLLFLKNQCIERYLALGIGNGGSFAMECFFMKETLKNAIEIDSLEYGHLIGQDKAEIIQCMELVRPHLQKHANLQFYETTTDAYFNQLNTNVRFDAIFIDADHSFEGANKDFANAQRFIADAGVIIFHDINSAACPGIVKLWQHIKKNAPERCTEFISSQTCGIGIVKY